MLNNVYVETQVYYYNIWVLKETYNRNPMLIFIKNVIYVVGT